MILPCGAAPQPVSDISLEPKLSQQLGTDSVFFTLVINTVTRRAGLNCVITPVDNASKRSTFKTRAHPETASRSRDNRAFFIAKKSNA